MKRTPLTLGLLVLLTFGLAWPGYAASSLYWTTASCATIGGAGTWDTATSQWSPNSTGGACSAWNNANSDSAYFSGTATYAVANSGNKTLNKIYVTIASEVQVSSSGILGFAGTGSGIDVVSGGYFSMACPFSGTLTKTSAGRVDANNSGATGKWVIQGGYISFAAINRFGTYTGSDLITFNGGGVGVGWASTYTGVQFLSTSQGITINSGGAFFGASASTDPIYIASAIRDGTGGTGTVGLNLTQGSPLASPYNAGCVVILTNATATANNYAGPTTVGSSCTLTLAANNQIPSTSVLTLATGATVNFNGGSGNWNDTVQSLSSTGGGSLNLGSGTLTLNAPAGENAGSAVISGTGGSIVMTTGTWTTSSGSCTYSGGFTLNGGTLYLAGNTALGTGTLTISGGTRIASNNTNARSLTIPVNLGADITFGSSANTGSLTFGTGAWTLKSGNRQITADTITLTINSAIGQDVSGRQLTKAGSGTLQLGGVNTYSGNTVVSAGTLEVLSGGSILGNVTVNGGTLKLDTASALASSANLTLPGLPSGNANLNFSGTQTINALYFGSTSKAQGTWGATGSSAQHTSSAFTTTTGVLKVNTNPNGGATTTTLSPIAAVCAGSASSLTATVTGSSPSGNVQFFNGGSSLGTAPVSGGVATLSYTFATGSYSITATYLGDDLNNQSTSGTQSAVVNAIPSAPSASSPQTFCSAANPTVANLVATGSNLQWYGAATGGTALPGTTALSTGTYYVSQTVSGCESARTAVSVTVNTTPAAPGASPQTFCSAANPTVANLVATGSNLQWYGAVTGGTALPGTTALSTGTYYVSQTVNSCESTRTAVSVTVNTTPAAPGASPQTFCSAVNPTVANLVATGSSLQWYGAATGGTALPGTTALSTGTYYVSQTVSGCESARTAVNVTVNTTPSAPSAPSPQTFCSAANPTVANLVATGSSLQWYGAATGGMALPGTTALSTGTYYVSQTVSGCESARASVSATVDTSPTAPNSGVGDTTNQTIVLNTAKLVARATGSGLSVTAVQSPSAQGGSVVLDTGAGTISYTAPGTIGIDNFTYTITDVNGCTASPTIYVTNAVSTGLSPNLVSYSYDSGSGTFTVIFAGIPGLPYGIERSPTLSPAAWTRFTNVTAGADGLFTVTDTSAPPSYYRTVYP
jgi:autotransporter-associated beta strand protein